MEFSEFFGIIHPIIGGGNSTNKSAKSLSEAIMDDSGCEILDGYREVSYSYVSRYDYASFYLIRKVDTKSCIKLCDDVNPNEPTERMNINSVKNSYAALWDEYKEVKSAVPLMNVIRRILEYYFLQLCGYEGT